jgi:hypothetical protein
MIFIPRYWAYNRTQTATQQFKELVAPVVRIATVIERPGQPTQKSGASGVIIYSEPNELGTGYDTYVLTCNHVVEIPVFTPGEEVESPWGGTMITGRRTGSKYEVEYVEIFNENGASRKVMGRVIAHSPNIIFNLDAEGNFNIKDGDESGDDLALIKLETSEHFSAARFISKERYNNLHIMERIRLVGCSLKDKPIPTSGEVTRLENKWMSTNANMIFGNSGGATYLEETNELIGITNAVRLTSMSQVVTHMGLIRPISCIYTWLDKIGYSFLYDKNFSNAARFATIKMENDNAKFIARDYTRSIEKQLKDLCAVSDKKIKELEGRINDLEELNKASCEQEESNSEPGLSRLILPSKVVIPTK